MKIYILTTLITLLITLLVFGGLFVITYLLAHYTVILILTLLGLLLAASLWKEIYDTLKKYQHSKQEE